VSEHHIIWPDLLIDEPCRRTGIRLIAGQHPSIRSRNPPPAAGGARR
jgi:hypothetical protein